jgi:DNA-binding transcriptional ArsR family regulator
MNPTDGTERPRPAGADGPGGVFACLADENRRAIVDLVAVSPLTATDLAGRLCMSRQGVMKHLRLLAEMNVVRAQRRGREVRYSVNPDPVREAARWLAARATAWDRQLDALRRAAESPG